LLSTVSPLLGPSYGTVCLHTFTGFAQLLEILGIFIENFQTWKVLENDLGTGKSWKLLRNDVDGRFWLQIDMFLQTNIAIIVATRYVFWGVGMP